MGRRGFGSIRRLPSGSYQARYLGPDSRRHAAPRTFNRKTAAEQWLTTERRYWEDLAASGRLADWQTPTHRQQTAVESLALLELAPTLDEYASRYMARPELRPSYVRRANSLLRLHILPTFGALRLPDITRAMVRGWWAALDPDKSRTNDLAYQLLRSMMNAAIADEIIKDNPVVVRGAGKASRVKGPETVTPAQVQAIADNMPPRLAMAVQRARKL